MAKTHLVILALATTMLLAAILASAQAKGSKATDRLAVQACAKERKQIGRSAFLKKYGERAPARACARRTRKKARAALRSAAEECLAELDEIGSLEFGEDYGSDESGFDAFEQCVEETAGLLLEPDDEGDSGDDEEVGE